MKLVVIGDIHGEKYWENVTKREYDSDVFIFIGDYFDSFNISYEEQVSNFKDIMSFKELEENTGKKVITLIGNHDYHYLPYIDYNLTSGYQYDKAIILKDLLSGYADKLDICYKIDNLLFSHAGISEEFLNISYGISNWSTKNIDYVVKDLFNYKPNMFKFSSGYETNYHKVDPSGNNTWQCPLWIRPQALMEANKGGRIEQDYIQIFGHTPHNKGIDVNSRYINIDTLHKYGNLQYITIEDGVITLKNI